MPTQSHRDKHLETMQFKPHRLSPELGLPNNIPSSFPGLRLILETPFWPGMIRFRTIAGSVWTRFFLIGRLAISNYSSDGLNTKAGKRNRMFQKK
jgi:hypothetical protein